MDAFFETMLVIALATSFVGGVLVGVVTYGFIDDRSRKTYKSNL